jgi:hypothetical protein
MELVNDTPLPAALVPTSDGGDEILMLVLTALTLDLSEEPAALAIDQEPLRLAPDPVLPNDAQLLHEGVSVCATGHVHAPRPGATEAKATLAIGDLRREVLAFGARVWRAGTFGGSPSPTSPRPFDRIPMRWENAFGGSFPEPARSIEKDGETYLLPAFERHHPWNPLGKGFYPSEKDAVEKPLPELENPESRIRSWDDQPEPVCFSPYPLFGGLRAATLLEGQKVNLDRLTRITGRSAPRNNFPPLPPGTPVALGGMRPGAKRLVFTLPEPPVVHHVAVGALDKEVIPSLDAIDIDADRERVRLLYRAGFRYPLIAGELRRLTVAPAAAFPRLRGG